MKFFFSLLCIIFGQNVLAQVEPITGKECLLKNVTTSWIGNDGGWEESHIPHDMLNMFVSPDGTVATICGWDEGGTNVGVYKDGKLISRPEGSGTGGWGRFSGKAVVLDENYVYQLLTQHGCDGGNDKMNINGVRQFPPCDDNMEWKTVRRYDINSGLGAPFKGGYGYKGDMLVICREKKRSLEGLAIWDGIIYVAVKGLPDTNMPDSIKIYSSKDMSYLKGYPVKGGIGLIYADNKKGLWMMREKNIIRMDAMTGKLLSQSLKVPEDVEALSFCIDVHNDRLLIPNRGKDMNVLIYENIYSQPLLKTTFGSKGGVFAKEGKYISGEAGPLRFSGPCAAGVDNKGNIYVANTTVSGGRGAVLEVYKEKEKKFLWKKEGLIFTATADFDRTNTDYFYSPEKIHRIHYDKEGGRMDELVAYTADPFRFPDDERVLKNGAFITSSFKRTIGGKSFLFISDMYGGMLAGYRFDKKKYGYIAIPCFFANNGDPVNKKELRFWVDVNGDAKRQDEEWHNIKEPNQYSMSFFVDHAGNIWRGTRGQGFLFWKMKGLNAHGVPEYEDAVIYPLPEEFKDAKRIFYYPEKDELYLAGFSEKYPDSRDTWWCMGSTIVKCSNFLKKAKKGEIKEGWKSDFSIYIPFNIEDGSGKDYTNSKAFTVEGEYIFLNSAVL